jgi:hypothetical protein
MAAFVDSTVQEIDTRLRELKDEMSKLEAARAALACKGAVRRGGTRRGRRGAARTPASGAAGTRARTSTRRPGAARGGRRSATRAAQTVELVRNQPGITIPELAKAMKIQPNYLYRVLPKLVADGQVKREGKGRHPAS